MIFFISVLVFFIGVCLGSFANVFIYRLPKNKQTITGRSFCPKCKKKIRWFDNIPLFSYLFLSGRCRRCHKYIPFQYFIVELISGVIFLLIYLNYDNYTLIIFLSVLFILYLIIFFIDLEHYIIPDRLNFTLMVLALLKNFLPNLSENFIYDISQSLVGGIAGYAIIWIIIYSYKVVKKIEAMGLGDAKLMAGIGLLFGWQSIPFVLFTASVLGLIFVIPSLINKKRNLKSQLPFGPFIILAGLIYFLYGEYLYVTLLKV